MRTYIKNLGKIKEADITLKPLTIFMGNNNTGKTYVSYLLYELMNLANQIFFEKEVEIFDKIINELVEYQRAEFDVNKYVKKNYTILKKKFEEIADSFDKNILNSSIELNKDIKFEIKDLEVIKSEKQFTIKDFKIYNNIFLSINDNKIIIEATKKIGKKNIRKGSKAYKNFIGKVNMLIDVLIKRMFFPNDVYFLPSERMLLIQVMNFLDPIKFVSNQDIYLYNLPKPLIDFPGYFKFLNQQRKSMFKEEIEYLEKEILQGNLDIKEEDFLSSITYKIKDKEAGLSIASSGVKSLSGFYLLLKYVLKKNSIVFIDEPELTLHPRNQIKLVQLFGMLINKGLNFVIATHSPYIVDYFNILIKGYLMQDKVQDILEKYNIPQKSLIDSDKVGAYLFKDDGIVMDAFNKETKEIEWETFGDVSDLLSIIDYEFSLRDEEY